MILLIVAVTAGTVWLRRPEPTVPAAPRGLEPWPGTSLVVDATGSARLVVLHTDHTMAVFDSAHALVHPVSVGGMSGWRLDGNVMIQDGVDAQGRACRATVPWRAESEGVVVYDTAVLEGPGCTGTSSPPSTQLSPVSDAGLKVAAGASDPAVPVTDPVQFDGVWLLRGTGLLLAFDEVPKNGGGYFLDHNGDIDRAPDTQGKVEMGADGLVTLTSPSCSDTLLRRPVLHGTSDRRSLTVTVEDDPCFWFGGEPVATLVKVL